MLPYKTQDYLWLFKNLNLATVLMSLPKLAKYHCTLSTQYVKCLTGYLFILGQNAYEYSWIQKVVHLGHHKS